MSPRPRLIRDLRKHPAIKYYKPQGVPLKMLEIVEITHEEWEAIRLKDVKKLNQAEAAKKMNTSQSTFQRILAKAHNKLGTAIVEGKAIKIIT
ncbi:DUF134 domain-containing protein [Patescibacteria group bacterium]|nr:DUF134 domain-containing protein [Patescibacteria group bacterium]